MSNTVIQQSLIDIEQNLKKLDSARNQVGKLAGKSEELISLFSKLVGSIELIQENYKGAESTLQQNMEKSRLEFEKSLNKTINYAEINSKEFLSNQEKFIGNAIEQLKDFQNKLYDTQRSIEEFDLEKGLNKIYAELSGIQETLISQHSIIIIKISEMQSVLDERLLEIQNAQKQNFILTSIGLIIIVLILIIETVK